MEWIEEGFNGRADYGDADVRKAVGRG